MTAPKPKRQTWTKAQQRSLNAWVKKHPFKNKGFPKTPKPRATAPSHGKSGGGHGGVTAYPGYPMVPVGGTPGRHSGGRHGGGRHGLAVSGLPLCAVLAVAESLRAATGTAADGEDLLALHAAAGGGPDGVPLACVLEAVARQGLAGHTATAVSSPVGEATVVSLGLELAQEAQPAWDDEPSPFWGLHVGYLTGGHVLTWGRAVPVTRAFLDRQALAAWKITWT